MLPSTVHYIPSTAVCGLSALHYINGSRNYKEDLPPKLQGRPMLTSHHQFSARKRLHRYRDMDIIAPANSLAASYNSPAYEYTPLNAARREIRVLVIHRGTRASPISCSLSTVSLDDRIKYQALSYVVCKCGEDSCSDVKQLNVDFATCSGVIPRTGVLSPSMELFCS
jgi:hypothetical protein